LCPRDLSIIPDSVLGSGGVLCVGVAKASNDTGKEKRDSVETAIRAEVDQNHDIEFRVFECLDDVSHFESFFLVRRVPRKTSVSDLTFSRAEELSSVRVL